MPAEDNFTKEQKQQQDPSEFDNDSDKGNVNDNVETVDESADDEIELPDLQYQQKFSGWHVVTKNNSFYLSFVGVDGMIIYVSKGQIEKLQKSLPRVQLTLKLKREARGSTSDNTNKSNNTDDHDRALFRLQTENSASLNRTIEYRRSVKGNGVLDARQEIKYKYVRVNFTNEKFLIFQRTLAVESKGESFACTDLLSNDGVMLTLSEFLKICDIMLSGPQVSFGMPTKQKMKNDL